MTRKLNRQELDDIQRRKGITLKWLHDTITRCSKIQRRIASASRLEDISGAVTVISDEVNSCSIHDVLHRAENELAKD